MRGNFWPCIGVTLLAYFLIFASSLVPCVGLVVLCFVAGPMFGGLFLYFLKQFRGQPAAVGDAFSGFNRPHFGQLALAGTVQIIAAVLVLTVLIIPAVAMNPSQLEKMAMAPTPIVSWWFMIATLPVMYLTICWILSYGFIIDKRVRFWDAMELSRKLVNMNLLGWSPFILLNAGMMAVNSFLSTPAHIALGLAVFLIMPVLMSLLTIVYEDIVSARPQANA